MHITTLVATLATSLTITVGAVTSAPAATPPSSTLSAPEPGRITSTSSWSGGPITAANALVPSLCTEVTCDTRLLTVDLPAGYWDTHDGAITIDLTWAQATDDFDLWIFDADGVLVSSSSFDVKSEHADLGELAPGTYTVQVVPVHAVNGTFDVDATLTVTGSDVPDGPMSYPESRKAVEDELVVDYPLNVVFVGREPTAAEVAELRAWIPEEYRPTVVSKSGDSTQDSLNAGAALLNWNQMRQDAPYFAGITYRYDLNILRASDDYARALFQVAEDNTAKAQEYRTGKARAQHQAAYDATHGSLRVIAKNGDPSYKVTEPSKTDLIDAYAVEDWIFESRLRDQWRCAFTNLESGECVDPSVIAPDPTAYRDPFYDKNGLNLDHMPQGLNKGSSFFFLDTFTPAYAKDYFRPNAYHTYGTDKVIDGAIVPKPVSQGGSWRVTDPDTGLWKGVDFARTWGGRYRFHFIDLGAAPNDYEAASWAGAGLGMSSDYPHGDPPVWQYAADPLWQQPGDKCYTDIDSALPYNNNTPCRMMPRLARDVAYGLFFRSTAGYLYRPIPRGDVYWLAVSNWTDFYSRPQWVQGALTNGGGVYGTWWTDMSKLFKMGDIAEGTQQDDTLRWLSSATPYARWVGRNGEVIPLYDPTNNQPTGRLLDTSPKYADLPAPEYHARVEAGNVDLVTEPLYGGEHEHVQYGDATVDLTGVSNAIERAKANGNAATGGPDGETGTGTYDGAVNGAVVRDYIDAHREGIADMVEGVNTIPSVNMVFEKAFTWHLPAIVGGVALSTHDNEAWGVLNNVNDRVKASKSHYPAWDPATDAPGSRRSLVGTSLPTQDTGGGFSYTMTHEAAHNLGLSHPHDGSFGVSRCPADDPDAGQWKCYWSGLGWMYDVSAAPTTYAMPYNTYEVEDQDNLQRGHVAEYLLAAQDALRQRLTAELDAGRTTPSAAWTADFARMKQWRSQAGVLFRKGDYLHAEYAARNASLAARGFAQTAANTSNPKLVGAGQVFYFNVHPQAEPVVERTNLTVTDLAASQAKPKQTVLTATVRNTSMVDASNVVVAFTDGGAAIGTSAPVAIAAGQTTTVNVSWNTAGIHGDRQVKATVDPADAIAETSETDNALTRTITVKGNKVTNGSFEESASGTQPDSWTSQGATYDTSGAHASDGTDAIGLPGGLLTPALVTTAPIPVQAGQQYTFATLVVSGAKPLVSATYLDQSGAVLGTATTLATSVLDSTGLTTATLTPPVGASQVKLKLTAPPTSVSGQTTWLDDVWLW